MNKLRRYVQEKTHWLLITLALVLLIQIVAASLNIFFLENNFVSNLYHLLTSIVVIIALMLHLNNKSHIAIKIAIWGALLIHISHNFFFLQTITSINSIVYVIVIIFAGSFSNTRTMFSTAIVAMVASNVIFIAQRLEILSPDTLMTFKELLYFNFYVMLVTWFFWSKVAVAEDAQREAENEYQRIFENLPIGLYRSSIDGKQLRANPALVALNGYQSEAEQIECVKDIKTEWYVDQNRRNDFKLMLEHDGKLVNFESEIFRHKSRERIWISEAAYAVKDENGNTLYYEGSVQDISERVEAEGMMRHMQRLDSLGILAGGIAHDFNNLLLAMLGQISVATMKLDKDDPAVAHLEKAKTAAQKAANLCNQLLVYSGKGHFKIEAIHLNQLIDEYLPMFEVVIPKNISFNTVLDPNLPFIEADSAQVQQTIINLLLNARDAINHPHGRVVLRTGQDQLTHVEETQADYKLFPKEAQPYVWLEVSDNGSGIAQEKVGKIFEPFFTTKKKGHGLGLSAVIGTLRGHNGGITIRTKVGQGTSIRLYFPLNKDLVAQAQQDKKRVASSENSIQSFTALIIDDQAFVRDAVKDILALYNISPYEATSGQEGVTLFSEHIDEVKLVILDMVMPGLTGEETFHQIRALNPDVPIIICSGFNHTDMANRLIQEPLTAFVGKPYEAAFLFKVIERLMVKAGYHLS